MKIDIKALLRNVGEELEIIFDATHGIQVDDYEDYHFISPLHFRGKLISEDSKVLHLLGTITIDWESSCVRCLSPVSGTEKVSVDERIYPEDYSRRLIDEYGLGFDEEDTVDDPEELSYHDGVSVELEKMLNDWLLLNLSLAIYCDENCPGLCPQCGRKVGDPACNCKKEENFTSAFDKLRELL